MPYYLILLCMFLVPINILAKPLRIFVSVLPMQTFVQQIGGQYVDVRAMVRPGYNPHIYDPTPQQIGALAQARLYIKTGVPFENVWMHRIQAANPNMQILDVRAGIELRKMPSHDHENNHEDHHGHASNAHDENELDPHVWTSPLLVKHIANKIRETLTQLDPDHAQAYSRNYTHFAKALTKLDQEIHALLDPLPNRKFMIFHPAWGYFAQEYNLIQVPIEREGKAPGPRRLANLIAQARRENVRVIFVQPQFDKRLAQQVAQAIGGHVISIDPLAADYIPNLRRVANQIVKALRR
ncbi:ABC transporter substrate-binding protein [Achromatium sp. WMS3]|nr:ABC transporter substrate-binding protein [Achromatium sp. WMS3]